MKKPKSSRGIIIKNKQILLIHRKKPNKNYYVIPGGKLKETETTEDALIREIKEETNLDLISFKKFLKLEDEQKISTYFFIDKYIGEPKANNKNNSLINEYKLKWIDLNEIKNIKLIPIQIKTKLLDYFI